ncbi:phage tail tube protein [Nocardiopsis alba]|uniref:Phage tail protein n=1 Tax=Nocardiopsis alba TaxID=53437 RepID=A0A7K2ILJ2_9ACTN|nr:phage tail protein [Nocardiopsis alba]MYR30736.1 phage tail protein [Nocardiopsis alba]
MVQIERSADLTLVGANGGGWVAPVRTAQPTALLDNPAAPWAPLGAINGDGLTVGFEEDSEEFIPWGYTTAFRKITTSSSRTFSATLWETLRPAVLSLMYRVPAADLTPDQATGEVSFAETASPQPDRRAFLWDVYDGPHIHRYYIPEGEVTDRGDVTHATTEMRGFELTFSAYPDAAGNTIYHTLLGVQEGGTSS